MTDATADSSLHAFTRDWLTIWQSELAALSGDREALEHWRAMIALWSGAIGAGTAPDHGPDRRAGTAEAPRTAAADAASDPRDDAIERLGRRVAELEQRIAELERRPAGGAGRRKRAAPP